MATNSATAYATQLKGLLAKSDGKDKAIALLQYAAMFTSGGEAGYALAVQKSLGAARKPFRLFKVRELRARRAGTRARASFEGRRPPLIPRAQHLSPFKKSARALPRWTCRKKNAAPSAPSLSLSHLLSGCPLSPSPRSPPPHRDAVQQPVEFIMPLMQKPPKGKGLAAALEYVREGPTLFFFVSFLFRKK